MYRPMLRVCAQKCGLKTGLMSPDPSPPQRIRDQRASPLWKPHDLRGDRECFGADLTPGCPKIRHAKDVRGERDRLRRGGRSAKCQPGERHASLGNNMTDSGGQGWRMSKGRREDFFLYIYLYMPFHQRKWQWNKKWNEMRQDKYTVEIFEWQDNQNVVMGNGFADAGKSARPVFKIFF